jgi:hypothetical protein
MPLTLPKLRPWQMTLTVLLVLADVALGTYALLKRTPVTQQRPPRQQSLTRPEAQGIRETRWREDLEFFDKRFPSVQVDSERLYPPAKFHQDIADLERDAPNLSDSEIILRVMRLVAQGGVSHITVDPQGELEFHPYPLQFFWYSDGAVLTYAREEYRSALGARAVRIGSMTPDQLEAAVAPYLSHENLLWLHELSPDFMLNREVADHFGLADADGVVEFTFERSGAKPFRLRVAPVSADSQGHMISVTEALHHPVPFYRKRPNAWYWYEYLADSHSLYIQYNRCRNDPKKSFKAFTQELFRFVDALHAPERIERVIVDLRFNRGGDSSVIDPLLQGLESRPRLRAKGRLCVLMGRGTFSSGMMAAVSFREDLHAILIGEASGSRPNEYGEVKTLTLPNSKTEIRYTTKYFTLLEDSDPLTLEPDVPVQRSIADFLSGQDKVLDTALKYRLPTDQSTASR